MKLKDLESVEMKAIEVPAKIPVPHFADPNNLAHRIFGALCRINPELPCMENEKFLKNVFTCIEAVSDEFNLPKSDRVTFMKLNKTVLQWRKCYEIMKDRKAEYNKSNKDKIKKENEARKEKYGYAIVNGEKDTLATGYTLEPEGIFFGRGDSPVNGFWKAATQPEDVVVNTNSSNLPVLIEIQSNGERVEKQFNWNTTWEPDCHVAAKYSIDIGIPDSSGKIKKIMKTSYKGFTFAGIRKEGQQKKYAAGTELGKVYDDIVVKVEKDFETKDVKDLGTTIAVFFLFEKGIRIGQKNATENGTKGLLSLVWNQDVKRVDDKIKFDFYGKDSVRDTSVVETKFADKIEKHWSKFGQLNTDKGQIQQYIAEIAPNLADVFTPKLARTAVACSVAEKALEEMTAKFKVTKESPLALKKLAFDEATMLVARRLNHQRGVNKVMEEKRKAKFKENELKLKERKDKVKEQIKKKEQRIEELKKKGDKERVKALKEQIENAKSKIKQAEMSLESKERNQNFANSTCKASYIDPSIVVEYCKKIDMPIEKVYTKAQLKSFDFVIK